MQCICITGGGDLVVPLIEGSYLVLYVITAEVSSDLHLHRSLVDPIELETTVGLENSAGIHPDPHPGVVYHLIANRVKTIRMENSV